MTIVLRIIQIGCIVTVVTIVIVGIIIGVRDEAQSNRNAQSKRRYSYSIGQGQQTWHEDAARAHQQAIATNLEMMHQQTDFAQDRDTTPSDSFGAWADHMSSQHSIDSFADSMQSDMNDMGAMQNDMDSLQMDTFDTFDTFDFP